MKPNTFADIDALRKEKGVSKGMLCRVVAKHPDG